MLTLRQPNQQGDISAPEEATGAGQGYYRDTTRPQGLDRVIYILYLDNGGHQVLNQMTVVIIWLLPGSRNIFWIWVGIVCQFDILCPSKLT